MSFESQLNKIELDKNKALIRIQTLGKFQVERSDELISAKEWSRDISVQLFQYLITIRDRNAMHKEQIVSRLWPDVDGKTGEQTFKVALHGLNKVLEPNRKKGASPKYVLRNGLAYQLNFELLHIDITAIQGYIAIGNNCFKEFPEIAIEAYSKAIENYKGVFLPNRMFNDWSSDERERIQVLILSAIINLSEMLLESNPMETIRLTEKALMIDSAWEDAFRLQMKAYLLTGNRPMVIRTYHNCERILEEEYGLDPLPATRQLYNQVIDK